MDLGWSTIPLLLVSEDLQSTLGLWTVKSPKYVRDTYSLQKTKEE